MRFAIIPIEFYDLSFPASGFTGSMHFINSVPESQARGNHYHNVGEVLVFLQGTWLLRAKDHDHSVATDWMIHADGTCAP
jgi:hypothetical protein